MRVLLSKSRVYGLFRSLVGGDRLDRTLVCDYLRPRDGMRLLDIGCGPAIILDCLPKTVDYVGFDPHERYIDGARARYGDRGMFLIGAARADTVAGLEPFDAVLALGVLHHLKDDEALELLRVARGALKPGGRLVTLDGCFEARQSAMARLLLRSDRGRHVRDASAYVSMAREVFDEVEAHTRADLLHVPYTHLVMQCTSEAPGRLPTRRNAPLTGRICDAGSRDGKGSLATMEKNDRPVIRIQSLAPDSGEE